MLPQSVLTAATTAMAWKDASSVTKDIPATQQEQEQEQEPALAPETSAGRGQPLRIPALQLMLFRPVPLPRLFLAWLVSCLSLFMPRA